MSDNNDSLGRLLRIDAATALPGHSDGLQAAHAFSPDDWRADATRIITELAQTGQPFTIDDVRRHGLPDPDKQQRFGSIIAALKATDVIRLHSLTLHRQPNGEEAGVRVWIGATS